MIRVTDLTLRLGPQLVLHKASLDLVPGRITVLLGPNGAGKSSLLRALAGLITPEAGTITLNNKPLDQLSLEARARQIGYLPQNGTPAWAITVRDLVGLGRLPYRGRFAAPTPDDAAAIAQALDATDLTTLADRPVDALSGGELARAKFARVLAGESDWILADEPLANLDPAHQRDVLALLRRAAASGKGVVTVLHQLSAAAQIADDVVMLRAGRCLAAGPAARTMTGENLSQAFDMPLEVVDLGGRRIILPQ
ncbi:MAG: ABC transporter ATP-binding protein [Chakrabartia sp.]